MTETPVPRRTLTPEDVTREYLDAATPGQGAIIYDDGYDTQRHRAEVSFSKWLHDKFGGDIHLLEEANQDKVHTPDYIWNGKMWDLKTVTTEKAANSALRHGLQQIRTNPGGIFLDYRGTSVDLEVLKAVVGKRLQWRKDTSIVDIMIVLDEDVQVWRY